MVTDNANAAPPTEQSCPYIVKNNQPRLRVYPRWFLLNQRNLVPVALKTRNVGFVAFNKMWSAGKLRDVPQWAEKVVRSIDNLIWMDNSHAITLVTFMWDICDPTQSEQNPNTVYEDCFHGHKTWPIAICGRSPFIHCGHESCRLFRTAIPCDASNDFAMG
jgi:hypothetical protein